MPPRPTSRRGSAQTADQKFRASVEETVRQILGSRKPWPLRKVRRAFERAYVAYILESEGADRVAAAATLDIGFSTLKEKIRVE
jgi:DNA-binding NtrC family response regulator